MRNEDIIEVKTLVCENYYNLDESLNSYLDRGWILIRLFEVQEGNHIGARFCAQVGCLKEEE